MLASVLLSKLSRIIATSLREELESSNQEQGNGTGGALGSRYGHAALRQAEMELEKKADALFATPHFEVEDER
jgi:hypothetical protein